mgnify:CR=1 FL=1
MKNKGYNRKVLKAFENAIVKSGSTRKKAKERIKITRAEQRYSTKALRRTVVIYYTNKRSRFDFKKFIEERTDSFTRNLVIYY